MRLKYRLKVHAYDTVVHIIEGILDEFEALRDYTEAPYEDAPHARLELRAVVVHDYPYEFINLVGHGIDLAALTVRGDVRSEP